MATSSLQSDLTCSVCLELYTEPLLLKCMHSFCRHCLSQIVEKKSKFGDDDDGRVCSPEERNLQKQQDKKVLECPDCRYVVILDEEGVEGLPRNFTLNNIVENFKKNSEPKSSFPCAVCERDPPRDAVKHCQQCRISYCEECLGQIHPKRGILAKHTLVTPSVEILEKESEVHPNSPVKLQQAVTDRDMWCKTCAVIYNCDSGKKHHVHNKHDSLTLKNAKIHMMSEMERMTLNLEQKKRKYGHMITSAEESVAHLMDDAEKKSLDIKHSAEKLHSMVSALERECLSALKKDTASKTEKRQDQIDAGKQHVTEIGHILQDVAAALEDQSNDVLFVQKISEINGRGKSMLNKTIQIDDAKMDLPGYVDKRLAQCGEIVQTVMKGDIPEKMEDAKIVENSDTPSSPVHIVCTQSIPSRDFGIMRIEWTPVPGHTYDVKLVCKSETGQATVVSIYDVFGKEIEVPNLRFNTLYDVTVCLHKHPNTESKVHKVQLLPKVNCPEFSFDQKRGHADLVYSSCGKKVAHEKTEKKDWAVKRLQKVFGTVGTYEIKKGNMYWEVNATFKIPRKGGDFVFDLGICSKNQVDRVQDLYKNYGSYTCNLVRRGATNRMQLEFDAEGCIEEDAINIEFVNTESVHLGFFLNMDKRIFSIIDVEKNDVAYTYHDIKSKAAFVPVFGHLGDSYCTILELLSGSQIQKIPSVVESFV